MIATYRLQFRPGFGFREVTDLLPYFVRLGVSHLYLSPVTEARAGSAHGYDVVDHTRLREELGGAGAFQALLDAADRLGLRIILDIVPNHAHAGPENERWQDVLAYGPASPYASFFDVEWEPLKPELHRKILLPFLGRPYGEALDGREITLTFEGGRFFAAYFDHRFAIAPATYGVILEGSAALRDLARVYAAAADGPREHLEALRPSLEAVLRDVPPTDLLAAFAGERLHLLLERQSWRLAYWKAGEYDINYRRFFYLNDLVALRVEDNQVFTETHTLVARLAAHPAVDGVRVDHIDGLFDPHEYLRRLRGIGVRHVWVEKILGPGETLPEDWPVEGATGYDFLNDALGILTDADGEMPLDRVYRRFVRDRPPYRVEVYRSKRAVMERHLVGELDRLAYDLDRLSEADYHTRDYSYQALREAVVELIAALDRYRTYLPYGPEEAERVLRQAAYRARQRIPWEDPSVFDFVLRVLLGDVRPDLRRRAAAAAGHMQQYASVVMAKGLEDTVFYRYVRLAALNEVGGDPARFGLDADAFHARARSRGLRYPRTMLATATHDHKRGEDLRARLVVLASIPEVWERTLRGLGLLFREHSGERPPAAGDVYLFAQTLIALWDGTPRQELEDRLTAYMRKAAREADLHTSWSSPNTDYEDALDRFIRSILRDRRLPRRIGPAARTLGHYGFINSITQLILKATCPGVPDVYQGSELRDLSLVDPDNRQPVDFALRARLGEELEPILQRPDPAVLSAWFTAHDERLKLYVTIRLLRLRRTVPEIFAGEYRALPHDASPGDALLGFARVGGPEALLIIVPRFPGRHRPGTPPHARIPAEIPPPEEDHTIEVRLPETFVGATIADVLTGTTQTLGDTLEIGGRLLPWCVLWKKSREPQETGTL
ncbi:MAG TPA: malto-oligosyltrehalose synthase [bacterium]